MTNNVMIDIETLNTSADAVIMSIGGVKFSFDEDYTETFYTSISIESNLRHQRTISESTLKWWMRQSEKAKEVFFEPKAELAEALQAFSKWLFNKYEGGVWSNGAAFDIPILEHAYRQLDLSIPWHYYKVRCMRTYRNLPGAESIATPDYGVAHNALDDAIQQVNTLRLIHNKLFTESHAL